ncbi:MAG: RNHCP domain-containing protein [Dehalococcoidia bacterium]
MKTIEATTGFRCVRCKREVSPDPYGTKHRNHCPQCLWSLHVDERPGDRAADCRGPMEPIAVAVRHDEWALIHRCQRCEELRANRIAGDDSVAHLLALAARPLAQPPFPLDRLA